MSRITLARFVLPRILYQLAISFCRAAAFSGGPTSEISTWEHSQGPLNGLEYPVIEDVLAGPNRDLLVNGQNEVGRPHDEAGGVDMVNFPPWQSYHKQNDGVTGKVFCADGSKNTPRGEGKKQRIRITRS
jgi:hypothetical protein